MIRVGVIGYGYWGPNLVRNFSEAPGCEVAAVSDLSQDRLASVSKRYPAVRTTTDYQTLLSDPSIDLVIIATPVSTHHPLGMSALSAGKHVFIEKPLAASTRDAAELATTAAAQGLVLMPGHTFLYSPPVVAIHDLIVSGALGDLLFISSSRVNLGLHQSDVSVVWDLGPHDFSILRYWLGETPAHVSATARACIGDRPDVAFIDLEYESGPIAHVELSWLAPSKLRRTTIVGSEKMVVYDDTSNEPVRVFDSGVNLREPETFGEFRLTYRTGDIVSPRIDAAEPLGIELRDFCNAINKSIQPRSSSGLGVEVVRMMEAVDRSLSSAGARISVDANALSPAVA